MTTTATATTVIAPPSGDDSTQAAIWGTLTDLGDPVNFDRSAWVVAVYTVTAGRPVLQGYAAIPVDTGPPNPDTTSKTLSITGQWTMSVPLGDSYAVALVSAADSDAAPPDALPTVDGSTVLSVEAVPAMDELPDLDTLLNTIPFPTFLGQDGADGYRVAYAQLNGSSFNDAPPDDTQEIYALLLNDDTINENFSNQQSVATTAGIDVTSLEAVVYQLVQWRSTRDAVETLIGQLDLFSDFTTTPQVAVVSSVAALVGLKQSDKRLFDWWGLVSDLAGLGINLVEPGMGTVAEDAFNAASDAEGSDSSAKMGAQLTQKVIAWGFKEGVQQGFAQIPSSGTMTPDNLLAIAVSDLDASITTNFENALANNAAVEDAMNSNWVAAHLAATFKSGSDTYASKLVSQKLADYTNIVWSKLAAAAWYVKAESKTDDGWPKCDTWTNNPDKATTACNAKMTDDTEVLYVDHTCCPWYRAFTYKLKKQDGSDIDGASLAALWSATAPGIGLSGSLSAPYAWGLDRIDVLTNPTANWCLDSGLEIRTFYGNDAPGAEVLPLVAGGTARPAARTMVPPDQAGTSPPRYDAEDTIGVFFSNFTGINHIAVVQGPPTADSIVVTVNLNEMAPNYGLDGGSATLDASSLGTGDFALYPYSSGAEVFGSILCSFSVESSS